MKKTRNRKSRRNEDRFWEKVRKTPSCWEWIASLDKTGRYGQFGFNLGNKQHTMVKAHRYSWELHNGQVPEGMCVLHKCDNRKCVRPDHLFIGTLGDNNRDRVAKGRFIGQDHPMAKLSNVDIVAIIQMRRDGKKYSEIATKFSICAPHACAIVKRKTWKHIKTV